MSWSGFNWFLVRVAQPVSPPRAAFRPSPLLSALSASLRRARATLASRSTLRASFFILMMSVIGVQPSQAATTAKLVRVAVVSDGPAARELFSAALIEREVANVVGSEVNIVLPASLRYSGDWSLSGVDAALDRALRDANADVVLTLGVLSSHQAAHRMSLAKPVIAAVVVDPVLQRFPLTNGKSGRHNFTYAADFQSIENQVRTFHQVVGFKHLTALVDGALLSALPQLQVKADEVAKALQIRITLVSAGSDAAAALAAIPGDADAVLVTGLSMDADALHALASGLTQRHLPSFSTLGRGDLDAGLLMTTGGAQGDAQRLARRLVLSIQRIAQGEDPAAFEVSLVTERRLMINMRVAHDIDFSPRWQDLTDAEQLYADVGGTQTQLTLLDALHAALMANPALLATSERARSSADDVYIARSNLLPSLDSSISHTRIDADRASPLTQAENFSSAALQLQTTLYSERAWANYSISQSLKLAAEQGERQDRLDTLEDTANAYLNVLRAKSVERVRRGNVENTRKNLETARVREAVGLAERSDYLRWVAQLARDKQEVLSAEATRRQAETELARVIHRPVTQPFVTVETGLDDPLALVSSVRAQSFLDTPAKWALFTDYTVQAALQQSSEIAQADAVLDSRRRALTAARRAFYVPDLAVVTKGARTFDKSGVGSTAIPGGADANSWSVTLQASLPIFSGGRRKAELSQSRHELRAAEADLNSVADAVEARTRAALHRTGSSYPSIELSNTAAKAANENLTMVTDAYARGAVSVTELIDAQNTALNAGLAAVDAKYSFLADYVAVLRAMSQFDILLDNDAREAWLQQVEQWFREHQGSPSSSDK